MFLHKELQSYRNELTDVQNEMKQIQMLCNSNNLAAREANNLATAYQTQFQAQDQLIKDLRGTTDMLQNDFMTLTKTYSQTRFKEQHQQAELERKIERLEKGAQEAAEAQARNNIEAIETLNTLRIAIEGKADVALVNPLLDRLKIQTLDTRSLSASTSVIYESIEKQGSISPKRHGTYGRVSYQTSTDSARSPSIQVEDSQKLGMSEATTVEIVKTSAFEQYNSRRRTTAPEDVDLDANAQTISYAGHLHPALNNGNKGDSLTMLPELDVKASRLAKINTLKQGRYEDWDTYHANGKYLRDSLPLEFEAAIVRQFVAGISEGVRRAQCRQWLENAGWNWENIVIFGNLCSQIDGGSRELERLEGTKESQATILNDIDECKASPAKLTIEKEDFPEPTSRSKWSVVALRRSQRLAERARRQANNNNISGMPSPAQRRSQLASQEQSLCSRATPRLSPNHDEIEFKGWAGIGRQQQEVAINRPSARHEHIDSSGTNPPPCHRKLNGIFTDQSKGIGISPTSERIFSSNETTQLIVPGKRRHHQSGYDQGYLNTESISPVDNSEERPENQNGIKKLRVSLRASPEIPILSTWSGQLSVTKLTRRAPRRRYHVKNQHK